MTGIASCFVTRRIWHYLGEETLKKICDALKIPEGLIFVMAKEDVPKEKALQYETLFP